MIFWNTLKLTFNNFANVWKLLLYRIICVLCVFGLTTVIAWPIINVLIKNNFFVNSQTLFEDLLFNLNLEKFFVRVDDVVKNFVDIVAESGYMTQTVLCIIANVIMFSFLDGYAQIAVSNSCNGYMSSLTKYAFTNSYVSNFGKSTIYNLTSLIAVVPLNLLIGVGVYLFASNLYANLGVFAVILAIFLLILLSALKKAIYSCWKPAIIVHNKSVFASLKKSIEVVFNNFFQTISTYLVLVVCAFILNLFAFTFTAGVGMLITLPFTTLMFVIADQVTFYEAMGMRYYVDNERIIAPKKLEQKDKIAKVKYII